MRRAAVSGNSFPTICAFASDTTTRSATNSPILPSSRSNWSRQRNRTSLRDEKGVQFGNNWTYLWDYLNNWNYPHAFSLIAFFTTHPFTARRRLVRILAKQKGVRVMSRFATKAGFWGYRLL